MKNLGQNIDVVAGIFDDTMLNLRNCDGFEISRQPICYAVSIHHRLADKNRLTIRDLWRKADADETELESLYGCTQG